MEDKNTAGKSDAALREERILEFWKEKNIFSKSLIQRKGRKEFIFYEGPPTANGMPGIHHLEARSFKDAIPRYKTMRGFHVRRKGGWDTHGLPVELQVEKKLGLNSKKAIEEYGVAKFNDECKESVWEYLDVWNKFTKRIGYWVDQENPYVTYHNKFIESVWNVVKKINKQGLLYKDYKVLPWCTRCGTGLSSHELAQGYDDKEDISVYVRFELLDFTQTLVATNEPIYLLAWTTTPWTLPGNVSIAINPNITYIRIKLENEEGSYILAKNLIEDALQGKNYQLLEEVNPEVLSGQKYKPLFDYYYKNKNIANWENGWTVELDDTFVTADSGTGIVHMAPPFGDELGIKYLKKYKIPFVSHVNSDGTFKEEVMDFAGLKVKEQNGNYRTDIEIIKNLSQRGLLFRKRKITHTYPFCWRCKTPLIYYARDSWYIRMSDPKIKGKLISENKKINWEPSYIREGRFGEWLKEIKDWAVSRERYWGTPLPVWECVKGDARYVIGSIEDLKAKTRKSGNKYFVMRHGESESNVKSNMHGIVSSRAENVDHLTINGQEQVQKTSEKLKDQNIKFDFVFVSPFMRTRETVDILKNNLGLQDGQIIFDKRLGELNAGDFEGKPWDEYRSMFKDERERFLEPIHGGESLLDVKNRIGEAIYEFEEKYKGKNILIISHGAPLWMLFALLEGYDVDQSINMTGGVFRQSEEMEKGASGHFPLFANAESRVIDFTPIPHNKNYELDLHRPYIDEVKLYCDCCGSGLTRVKEVMDVWFDSGAIPLAQDHYPFENKKWVEGPGYPADYISEGVDQTRGWFYTLHAIGVLMGKGLAYKNVICLGLIMDAFGKKMSKSVGNIVEPFEVIDKYGVDTLRLWMYSVNQPGESKNFDEKTVSLLSSQVFGLLYNILSFYKLYRNKTLEKNDRPHSKNILDMWILTRLDDLIVLMTQNLDNYKLLEPTRAVRDFIGDLSTWYLRRSRDRIKNGDEEAKKTLYFVLKNLAILMAPLAPFAAEDIWIKLRNKEDKESVHLENWPEKSSQFFLLNLFHRPKVLERMETVRNIVTLGLEARQKAGIKVRQPLQSLEIVAEGLPNQYLEIIKDELNIKNVVYSLKIKMGITKVTLDTTMTKDLQEEGNYRELLRALQDMRKKEGLTPSDVVVLTFTTDDRGRKLIEKFEPDMKKTVLVREIIFGQNEGQEVRIDDVLFKVKIDKIQAI